MKKTLFTALLLCALLSSHAQYKSFFGDSTWSYSVSYIDWFEQDYVNEPYDPANPLGTHVETFVYCFDKKDSVVYDYDTLVGPGVYYHGNRDCELSQLLLNSLQVNMSSTPNPDFYIYLYNEFMDESEAMILHEDTTTGRLYRNSFLMCDMSLMEGDTFVLMGEDFNQYSNPYWPIDTIKETMIVDSINYISGRKVIYLSLIDHLDDFFFGTGNNGKLPKEEFTIRFIEGIGPTYGFVHRTCEFHDSFGMTYSLSGPRLPFLNCVYKDGNLAYTANPAWSCDLNTAVEEHPQLVMNIYPNPATEYVNLDFSTNEEMNGIVEITDMLGRTCKTQHAQGVNCRIMVGNLPVGMYILTYTDKNRKITRKFMKE